MSKLPVFNEADTALESGFNTESSKFMDVPVKITESRQVKSGLFTDEQRAAVPPELRNAFESAFTEVEEAMDLVEDIRGLPTYGILKRFGVNYIKKPNGEPERVEVYIHGLEKSTLDIYRKYNEASQALTVSKDMLLNCQNELDTLKAAVPTKKKKGKKS